MISVNTTLGVGILCQVIYVIDPEKSDDESWIAAYFSLQCFFLLYSGT